MSVLSLIPDDKKRDIIRKESLASVYSSNSRLNLLNKRKRLNPLGEMSGGSKGDRYVAQRVLSAKAHRVKQLQNQLADAHYHLQELSNENRTLRALQKKQEIALQRYENSNAELPSVLNSHNEEIRFQQVKYKQLKQQLRDVTQKLKDRDMQLQQLKDEHQHLLELSRDRNLLEREKLQAQVTDLSARVQQQNETISMLQRRIALEAKNFRHQLQNEINKHKDTRHDLELAIGNADKLTTIIEMKEKMLGSVAIRNVKSPSKAMSTINLTRPMSKTKGGGDSSRMHEDRSERSVDQLTRLCENSRNIASALSHEDESSSTIDHRNRFRSRTNSSSNRSTPNNRKNSKESDDTIDLAKTVQEGMADLAIFEEKDKDQSPSEMQQQIEMMKQDLMSKIKKEDQALTRRSSFIRRQSTEESIEEKIETNEEKSIVERPKSRGSSKGRRSSVSFYDSNVNMSEETISVSITDFNKSGDELVKYDPSKIGGANRRAGGKPLEKYCKDIIQDIETSSKAIEKHMKQFSHSKMESDKLVGHLLAVDKINEYVNANGEIPEETLRELNNNFKELSESFIEPPLPRQRSITNGRRMSRIESSKSLLDDSSMSNQDMLDDLLGRK